MPTQSQLTEYLEELVTGWPRRPTFNEHPFMLHSQPVPVPVAAKTSPQELAEQMLASTEFRVLKLGTWLQTPDGQLITAAVEALSPPPLREDVELLVTALTLAAKAQQGQGRVRAATTGIVASVAVGLAVAAALSE